jgi:type II secretory pathway component PulJ
MATPCSPVSQQPHRLGFSLLEVLLYVAIFAVVTTAIVGLAASVSRSNAAEEARAEVQQNLRFSLATVGEAVRRATGVTTPPAGGTDPALQLTMADSTKNPTVFDVNQEVLRLAEGIGAPQSLTSSRVRVTALSFQHLANAAPAKPTVAVTMTVAFDDQGRPGYQYAKTEQTTVSLR